MKFTDATRKIIGPGNVAYIEEMTERAGEQRKASEKEGQAPPRWVHDTERFLNILDRFNGNL